MSMRKDTISDPVDRTRQVEFSRDRRRFILNASVLTGAAALSSALPEISQSAAAESGKAPVTAASKSSQAPSASLEWFSKARFGIFVHWGLYSVHGRDVWAMYYEQTPVQEYRKLAEQFVPKEFDPDQWAATAKKAGAHYMVMCTRQHDGFSMFDSAVSDFTSVKSAARRDFVKEYAAACRRAGLGVGFYYSLLDWRKPAYFKGPQQAPNDWKEFVTYVHAQVRELCTNYGKIDVLWFDGFWPYKPEDWRSKELITMIRSLQPGILINDRTGEPGDFVTPEQSVLPASRPWETCMTLNDHWGYCPTDHNWKDPALLVAHLVRCAAYNGNFLLNVGPDAQGRIPQPSVERLEQVGRWLSVNAEAIYGTEDVRHLGNGDPGIGQVQSAPTLKGNTVYLHLRYWSGEEFAVGNVGSTVKAVRFVEGNRRIQFRQEGTRVLLSGMPRQAPDPLDTVIAVECEGVPRPAERFSCQIAPDWSCA